MSNWILDNPIQVALGHDFSTISPVFDGKNVWLVETGGTALRIEFWGPYADLSNDNSSNRYLAPETDATNLLNLGPAVRILHSFNIGLTSVAWAEYYENYVYAMGQNVSNQNTFVRWPVTASSSSD